MTRHFRMQLLMQQHSLKERKIQYKCFLKNKIRFISTLTRELPSPVAAPHPVVGRVRDVVIHELPHLHHQDGVEGVHGVGVAHQGGGGDLAGGGQVGGGRPSAAALASLGAAGEVDGAWMLKQILLVKINLQKELLIDRCYSKCASISSQRSKILFGACLRSRRQP